MKQYKIHTYPDGGKYVEILSSFKHLIYYINNYEDLFLLKSIKDANPELISIEIPCMFQQQHDMRFKNNESFELKVVCDFINSLNFERVYVYHPHSSVTPALLNNCIVLDNTTFINYVLQFIYKSQKKAEENCILMSTDAGGYKSIMKLADKLDWKGDVQTASKYRTYVDGESKIVQDVAKLDFGGKDILLIDDICVYGGTLKGLSNILQCRNAGKLYAANSHMTIQQLGHDPVTNYFSQMFTVNTKFPIYYSNGIAPLTKEITVYNLF